MQLRHRYLALLSSACALVLGAFVAPAALAAPVCQDITTSTPYGTEKVIPVDCTGNAPTDVVSVSQDPFLGTAIVENNELHYTPFPGEIGQDQFQYVVTSPSTGASTPRTITVDIIEPAPICQDVGATTPVDTPVAVEVDCSWNDFSDPVTIVDQPSHGTVDASSNTPVYTPATGYVGTDTFTYTVTNDGGTSVKRTASVLVVGPPPVCSAVSANTAYETPVAFDTDCTGDGPSDTITVEEGASHGIAIVVGGQLFYTPNEGYAGPDSFTYTVTNNGGTSNTAAATVTVAEQTPVCQPKSAVVGISKAVAITLSCTSTIPQTYEIVASATHGTLNSFNASTGAITYASDGTFVGTDTFTYRATNTSGAGPTVAVSVEVRAAPGITVGVPATGVAFGTKLSATGTVTGRVDPGSGPATVDLRLYGPGDTTCANPPVFEKLAIAYPQGGGAVNSGEFTPTLSGTYRWRASYSGDPQNVASQTVCGVAQVEVAEQPTVQPGPPTGNPPPDTPAPTTPAPTTPTRCTGSLLVLDAVPTGKRARVTGIAPVAQAGAEVVILRNGKSAGTTKVLADGTFTAAVSGKVSPGTKYRAKVGTTESALFKYDPALWIVSRKGSKVSGQLNVARSKLPKQVDLVRVDVCKNTTTSVAVSLSKLGRFTTTLAAPNADEPYALYRVSARLGSKTRTFSTQLAVPR